MKILPLVLALVFFASPAFADEDFNALTSFLNANKNRHYQDAENYVSKRSVPYLKKYSAHDLGDMAPQDVQVLKSYSQNNFRYLQVASQQNPQNAVKATTVAFVTENNTSRIDIPETLRLGFGPNWEQHLNTIEQTYLFTKQQWGEAQSRKLLSTLLGKRN